MHLFRLLFILCLSVARVAGCNSRRLGSSHAFEESPRNSKRQLADDDDSDSFCGYKSPSIEERLEIATMISTMKESGRKLSTTNKTYSVPVYFWHTYSPGSTSNEILTEEFIRNNQWAALVHGFRDTPFQFTLQGIEIIESAEFGRCEMDAQNERDMKRALRVAGKNVLNIWICDSRSSSSGAWSSFPVEADTDPFYDGVVLRNTNLVADDKKVNTIQNLIHEAGHFFGLEHTFAVSTIVIAKFINPDVGMWSQLEHLPYGRVAVLPKCTKRSMASKLMETVLPTRLLTQVLRGSSLERTRAGLQSTFLSEIAPWCLLKSSTQKYSPLSPPLDTCKDLSNGIDAGPDPVHNYM